MNSSFAFGVFLSITLTRQTGGVIVGSAKLGSVSMPTATLTEGLVAWLVVATVEFMIGVPTGTSPVVGPAAKLRACITFRLRLGRLPAILATKRFMAGIVDPPTLGVTIGIVVINDLMGLRSFSLVKRGLT